MAKTKTDKTQKAAESSNTPAVSDPKERLKDFRNFLYLFWKEMGLPDPTPVQYEIAEHMQHGGSRVMVQGYRGVGKSWIASAYCLWALYFDQSLNILVVSATKQRADDFSAFCLRGLREVPWLQHLQPRGDQRGSKIGFDVAGAPNAHAASLKSVGITGQITGSRADIVIPDDIEVPNNSATQAMRDKLAESIKEFEALMKPAGLSDGGLERKTIFLGTPQTEETVYRLLPDRGFKVRVWPARYPDKGLAEKLGDSLSYSIAKKAQENPGMIGTSTDPGRFTDDDLLAREASYGRSGFALQYMLDTSLADANRYPLKLADLMVLSLADSAPTKCIWGADPNLQFLDCPARGLSGDRLYRPRQIDTPWDKFQGMAMAIDPAGRGDDEAAWCVGGVRNGLLYLLDMGGIHNGYTEQSLEFFAQTAKRYKINRLIYEANWGDGMFGQLLKPVLGRIYPVTVEEVKHSIQKEKRIIDTLEPLMNQHRLVVNSKILLDEAALVQRDQTESGVRKTLSYQLTRLTRERGALPKDDRIDVLAIWAAYWSQAMARDIDQAVEQDRQDIADEAEKRREAMIAWSVSAWGQAQKTPAAEPTWISRSVRKC